MRNEINTGTCTVNWAYLQVGVSTWSPWPLNVVRSAVQCGPVGSKVGCTVYILVTPPGQKNPSFGPLGTEAHVGQPHPPSQRWGANLGGEWWGGAGTAPPAPCRRGKAEGNHSIAAPQAPRGDKWGNMKKTAAPQAPRERERRGRRETPSHRHCALSILFTIGVIVFVLS
eukprot:gene18816-biopygen3970